MYDVWNIFSALASGYRPILPSGSIKISPMKRDRKRYFEENAEKYQLTAGFKKIIAESDDAETTGGSFGEYQISKPKKGEVTHHKDGNPKNNNEKKYSQQGGQPVGQSFFIQPIIDRMKNYGKRNSQY